VAKFTTGIATQEKLLTEAFKATGLTLRKQAKKATGFAFATAGAETAGAIAPGAWRWGKMGMDKAPNDRPKRGDFIVLAFRSGEAGGAAKQLNYLLNVKYGTGQKKQADQNARAKLAESQEANRKAEESEKELQADPKVAKWQIENATNMLTRAVNKLNAAKKAADDAASALAHVHVPTTEEEAPYIQRLEEERADSAAAGAKRLEENPVGTKKRYLFQFSHVGFLQNIELLKDGREKWTAFDGGQLVMGEGKKDKIEGSQTSIRYYDPRANEISGEKQQGGEARWLYGWVDVDMLVAEPDPAKNPK